MTAVFPAAGRRRRRPGRPGVHQRQRAVAELLPLRDQRGGGRHGTAVRGAALTHRHPQAG